MRTWFTQLDDLLRGRQTDPALLQEGRLELPAGRFVVLAIGLGATYGFFVGWYALFRGAEDRAWQVLAAMAKVPALFLLTLLVTFPSLYVFNALVGCRLSFLSSLRLLVAAITVNVTVAASLGPILGFFTLSTSSYPFMVLLNVALMAIAGAVALGFLLHTLRRLAYRSVMMSSQPPKALDGETGATREPRRPGPLDDVVYEAPTQVLGPARSIFRIWVLIYALVGAQMAWLLRPFIGSPEMPFTWFRHREGNFFLSVADHVQKLVGE